MEIHFSPELQSRLAKAASATGCGVDQLVQQLVAEHIDEAGEEDTGMTDRQNRQAAANAILELQKKVKPDPEGWTIRDYINHGRR